MSTDRELLELAAKAAAIEYDPSRSKPHPVSGAFWGLWLVIHGEPNEHTRRYWNPLADAGDALLLAVKLRIPVKTDICFKDVSLEKQYAATRLAIVLAAAVIDQTAMP